MIDELINFGEKIKNDIKNKCGFSVYAETLASKKIKLYKNPSSKKAFAYISQRPTLNRFHISTSEDSAITANVLDLADKRAPFGWFRYPASVWIVRNNEIETYNKALMALTKICVKFDK